VILPEVFLVRRDVISIFDLWIFEPKSDMLLEKI